MHAPYWSRFAQNRQPALMIAAGMWLAYCVFFALGQNMVGEIFVSMTMIPLVIAGLVLGPRGGLALGVGNILLHLLLYIVYGKTDWLVTPYIVIRVFIGLIIPVSAGWFGDVYRALQERTSDLAREHATLKQEIAEREKAEQALTLARDNLELRVKERTAELRQSEERYRIVSEITSDYAFSMRLDTHGQRSMEWDTGGFSRITGYTLDELDRWESIIHPDDLAALRGRVLSGGDDGTSGIEVRYTTKSGDARWLLARIHAEVDSDSNRPVRVFGAIQDITDRKRAEEALRANELRNRVVSEMTADFAYSLTIGAGGKIMPEWFGGALRRATGYDVDELAAMGGLPGIVHPEDRPRVWRHLQTVIGGQQDTCEFRIITKSGEVRWNRDYARQVVDESGKGTLRIHGAGQDITERKLAEESLRAVHEYTRGIIESSLDMIIAGDLNDRITEFNQAAQNAFGYTLQEALGQSVNVLYEDTATAGEIRRQLNEWGHFATEVVNRRKDGSTFPALLAASVLRNANGETIGYMGISRDITEPKRVAEALRASEARSTALVDAIPDMMVRMNKDGVVLDFKGAKNWQRTVPPSTMIGRMANDILAQDPHLPEGAIRQLLDAMKTALRAGETQVFESKVPWFDGFRYYETRLVISGADETLGIVRDITQRKQAEEERERLFEQVQAGRERLIALSQRLVDTQELERRHIAQELHDQVGQNLTSLSINLNIIRSLAAGEDSGPVAKRVEDSLKLVDATVERIRDVMAQLRPAVLDDYGLEAGLRWLAARFSERVGVSTQVEGIEFSPRMPIEKETALFRIAQEALNNVAKHANARSVTMSLETAGDRARLKICDDGIGFEVSSNRASAGRMSWGLSLMRERARGVGGEFFVNSTLGRGTEVIVELPR